jgi:hypothetical protein
MDWGSALEREKNFFFCLGDSPPLRVVAVETVECVDAVSLRFWEPWVLFELEETKLVILVEVMLVPREEIVELNLKEVKKGGWSLSLI